MERSARAIAVAGPAAGVVLSLLMLWSAAAVGSSAAAATVRVGVVLDLTSDVGRKSLSCISTALGDFHREHTSGTTRVELRVRDSRGEVHVAAQAARDLIENAQVQAIILGLQTSTEADFVAQLSHGDRIPVLSSSGISPTSCVFWLEDPVTASKGQGNIGFTLGNASITFLNPATDGRNGRKLEKKIKVDRKCQTNTVLRIAVPLKQGFQTFVNITHPNSKGQTVGGYSIEIFETAIRNLQPRPCYKFFPFKGSYDELVGNVSSGGYDGAVGDVTITAKRVADTDFTMPYIQSGVSMLVLAENEQDTIQWTFVKPLNGELWLAIVGFFFYTGFVVWMVEGPRNQEYQGSILRQFSTTSYFIFSTLTFSHGQVIRSPLSKIVVVVWCFVVLILVQSYTASLSSILTAKRLLSVTVPLSHNDFIGYQDGSFVRSILINIGFSENRLSPYTKKEEYADALRKGSKNGGVSAIIDEIPYLTSILADPQYQTDFKMVDCTYCFKKYMAHRIFETPGFGYAFRLGFPLLHNLSTAILNLTGGDEGSEIKAKWFPQPSGASTVHDTDSVRLTVQSFSGLFVITGSISTLVLLISIVRLVHAKCARARTPDAQSVNNGSGDEESRPLQNGVGDDSVPGQPLPEAVNNDFWAVHGSDVENAGNQEPCQQNGMHSGSVPAESLQIEMSNV